MIRFEPSPAPEGFDSDCRQPGRRWLADHPQAPRPRDYWSTFKPELARGFHQLCAYSAMYEPVGTVDHFVSFHEAPALAYEWTNYRYASHWLNSAKQDARVLDPFEVEDDWFEILLPSLQLVLTDKVPPDRRELQQRREWYRMYEDGELSLAGLRKKAPLLARAIEKNGS